MAHSEFILIPPVTYRRLAAAHIPRHTMATALLFNSCPIGHINVILGHDRLDTTSRRYPFAELRCGYAAVMVAQ
jgi:integrase